MYINNYVNTTYGVSPITRLLSLVVGIGMFMLILGMALLIFLFVAMWKFFVKAGKPGWAALIPIYNFYIMCEIAEKEWWYILLLCVPILNIYAMFVIYDGIAKKFGKTTEFTIGMMFLPYIFFPILAFEKNNNVETPTQSVANENGTINNRYESNSSQNDNNQTLNNEVVNSPEQTIASNLSNGGELTSETDSSQAINTINTPFVAPVQNVVPEVNVEGQNNVQMPRIEEPIMQNVEAASEPVVEQMSNVAPTFENNINEAENMVDTSDVSPVQNVVPEVSVQEQPIVEPNVVESAVEQMPNAAPTFENNMNQVENMVDTSNVSPVQNVVPEVSVQEQQNVGPVVDNKIDNHTSLWSNNNNNQ